MKRIVYGFILDLQVVVELFCKTQKYTLYNPYSGQYNVKRLV